VLLVLGFTAIASLALVFGLLVGAGVAPWLEALTQRFVSP
jgi:hypothetical protein